MWRHQLPETQVSNKTKFNSNQIYEKKWKELPS